MKRGMALVLVALLSACFVFAEGSYVVKSVKGKVQYEAAPGKMQDVKVGQTLSASTVVDTGLNSILVLTIDGKDLTIKAKQKGTVEKVAVGGGSGTLKKGGTVAGKASSSSNGSKSGVNTASSRASEAKEDVDWDEE